MAGRRACYRAMMYPEKQNFLRVLRRDNPSHVPSRSASRGACYAGAWPTESRPADGVLEWRDEWGTGWSDLDGEVFPTHPSVLSCEQADEVPVPNPCSPGRMRLIEEVVDGLDREQFMLAVGHPYMLYERAINVLGAEEIGIALAAEGERAHRLLDRIVEFHLGIARQYIRYGPGQINLSDDYGHQDRLAMSPECWREFFKPRVRRIIDFYRASLGPEVLVCLHSCGHVMPILEDLMEIGVDILHPVQSRANDLVELRRRTSGRLTLCGAIDGQQVLPFGTPADVRREVFQKLDLLWENGGYLPAAEKELGVSKENMEAMTQAIREWSDANVGKQPA